MSVEMKDNNRHNPGNDPLELRIKDLLQSQVYTTESGKIMMSQAKELEIAYLKEVFPRLKEPQFIHDRTQQLLKDLSLATKSKIVEGEEFLEFVDKDSPIFAVSNHFSAYKLIAIDQKDVNINIPEVNELYIPPMFYASMYPVAEKTGRALYDAHLELPGVLGQLQQESGILALPEGEGVFEESYKRTRDHDQKYPDSITVIFPEGRSSGKYNNGGPYDLYEFSSGPFAMAAYEGATLLPIAQYFNPSSGFELKIFPPIKLDPSADRSVFKETANKTRAEMQAWLDTKKTS